MAYGKNEENPRIVAKMPLGTSRARNSNDQAAPLDATCPARYKYIISLRGFKTTENFSP